MKIHNFLLFFVIMNITMIQLLGCKKSEDYKKNFEEILSNKSITFYARIHNLVWFQDNSQISAKIISQISRCVTNAKLETNNGNKVFPFSILCQSGGKQIIVYFDSAYFSFDKLHYYKHNISDMEIEKFFIYIAKATNYH